MASKPVFYLIDGHAVAYRQFFGVPIERFTTSQGEPTNAVYGFARILLDIIQKDRPDYLAVSFDEGLSGRDERYSEYKGTREKMPDPLAVQITRIRQLVQAFNIPVLALEGYEADDIIGTVTAQIPDVHFRIITGDRDLLQLLTDDVNVALPSREGADDVYDVAMFEAKYNLRPDQLIDLKALVGDSSDNIPGIRGIGDKTATPLLQTYDTLDGIYANLDQLKGATRKKIEEGRDMAYLSQYLARIQRDVPITIILKDCTTHDFDRDRVAELFRELEFRGHLDRLFRAEENPEQSEAVQPAAQKSTRAKAAKGDPQQMTMFGEEETAPAPKAVPTVVDTVIVDDEAKLVDLVRVLNGAKGIVWDVETTGLDQMAVELVGIALAVDGERGYYVPVGHEQGQQLPLQTVIDAIRPALTNPNIPKYAHNAAYDLVVMSRYGVDVTPIEFDSMIAEWLLDPSSKFLGLKAFADQYLKVHMTPISELIGTGKKQKTMAQVYVEEAAPYAAADAALTYRAVDYLRPKLIETEMLDLFHTLDMPLVPVIAAMEKAGVMIETTFLREFSGRLAAMIRALEKDIYALSGGYGDFNINSPKQLNDVLFGKLGLPTAGLKKTTHGFSTDVVTLEALKDEHEIVRLILEYRELTKLQGTYADALPQLINPATRRIHTSYNQTGTTTGRISSNNPNLQNIPIRTELGREIRRAFIADEGCVLLAVDYSQIELRVLAHVCKEQTLLDAFAQGQDIHRATAAAVSGITLEDVTYEQRSFAKRVNFGLIYGMGAYRLARDSELTLAEANAFIEAYFRRLPKVRDYINDTREKAQIEGYVQTLFGRKRFFPLLQSAMSHQVREAELRAAINMPIQGTAADIMKRAMIDLHSELCANHPNTKMILQVHDELVLEVPEDEMPVIRDLVVRVMENAYPMDAPLKANAQAGKNWRDMTAV